VFGTATSRLEGSTVLLAANAQGGGNYTLFILMGLMLVAMYFLMIRPQQRRRKQVETMQSAIGTGDEVLTIGGLYGTVRAIDDESVTLEVAPGVTNRFARAAIGRVVTSAARPEPASETADNPANPVVDSD
jgi:preprotein translocase subunit YajC